MAVEPSGQMASTASLDGAEASKVGPIAGGEPDRTATTTTHEANQPKMNGHVVEPASNLSDANRDKAVSAAEDTTSGMLPADPKDEGALPGVDTLADKTEGLGPILKGSPFEGEESKKNPTQTSAAPKSHPLKQPSKMSKGSSTASAAESPAQKPRPQPDKALAPAAAADANPSQQQKGDSPPSIAPSFNGKPKDYQAHKPANQTKSLAISSGIQTQKNSPGSKPTAKEPSIKSPSLPRTPTTAATPARQSSAKVASPKPVTAAKDPKSSHVPPQKSKQTTPDGRRIVGKASASTAKPAAGSKPSGPSSSTDKSTKKIGPVSPQGIKKPRPKSPTRPVRLPASATAPTAASAAKHDSGPQVAPSRSPSRTSNSSTFKKPRTASSSNPSRPAHVRSSLPPGSKPTEKSKTKTRTSMTSTKAPEGSFLERMMKPTQSSAQKTHEKVETKSPPRKAAVRPKRKSEESATSNGKSEDKESKEIGIARVKETPEAEAKGVQPLPLTAPASQKGDEVAEEVATSAPEAAVEHEHGQ